MSIYSFPEYTPGKECYGENIGRLFNEGVNSQVYLYISQIIQRTMLNVGNNGDVEHRRSSFNGQPKLAMLSTTCTRVDEIKLGPPPQC